MKMARKADNKRGGSQVSVFFCLSGFVMTYSYWNRPPQNTFIDSVKFVIKKNSKLYPLHLIMLFWGSIFLLINNESITELSKKLVLTIPLLQTWFPVRYQAINSVSWYLSVCVFLYLCFPYLLTIIKKYNKKLILNIFNMIIIFVFQFIIALLIYKYTNIDIKWITYCHPVYRLGDFLMGGVLASIYKNKKINMLISENNNKLIFSVVEIITLFINFVVCIIYAISSKKSEWFTYTCLFIPSTTVLIYVFSLGKGIITKLLKNKLIFWIANISSYAYLIHRLVIYYVYTFTKCILHNRQISLMIEILLSFVITVFSVYLYIFIKNILLIKLKQKLHRIIINIS